MPSAKVYFKAADRRLTFLRQQALALKHSEDVYGTDARRLRALSDRTYRELVGYLLPALDSPTLSALEERLQYPGLLPVREEFDAKLAAAAERRSELEAMEEVAHREIVEATIRDQLAEIAEPHAAMKPELEWWEYNAWKAQLDINGWFFGDIGSGLWTRFLNWRAASFLMRDAERHLFVKFSSPEELRDRYRKLKTDFPALDELHSRLTRHLEEIVELNDEHALLVKAPANLGVELFEALGQALRAHVDAAPVELLYATAKDDKHLVMFLKKLKGLEKQESYFRQLMVTRIGATLAGLNQEITKLERKVRKRQAKHWRGKFRTASAEEVAGLQNLKEAKWKKRHARLGTLRDRLASFDRYDEGSFGEHYLWWDVMTKHAPADDIYEVKAHHDQYGTDTSQHPHAALETALGELAAHEDVLADAADAMADDMMSGSDDWSTDAS